MGYPCILDLSIHIRNNVSRNIRLTELDVSIRTPETLKFAPISRLITSASSWDLLRCLASFSKNVIIVFGSGNDLV